MPEIKKVFLRGKMNKDLDERLIPDGEYTDAQNIQVSSTNESDAGTVQNIRGTKLLTDLSEASKFGTGAKCIGKIADEENDKIYWFVKSPAKQGIIEHDTGTDISKPLVIDIAGTILNFPDYEITGIAILDRNIIWTDNNSEPKIIDIDEFVTYSTYTNTTTPYAATTQISNSNITEEDITVIKKKPISAPGISITKGGTLPEKPLFEDKIVRFAYRWKFKNGQYSVISPFTDPIFDPNLTGGYNLDEGYNDRMLNNILSVTLSINQNTYPSDLNSIDILYKEANNANVYIYKTITNVAASVSLSITKESVYSVLPENQLIRQYDNVPYKAKALDIIGNRLVFGNYVDGIELGNYDPDFNQGSSNTEFVTRTAITGTNSSDRRTIKSGRTYQLGVAFEDKYGRQTPVISNESGLIKRNYTGNAPKKLNIKMGGSKPSDARITHYKYYIKDSAAEYYNFIAENVYDDNQNTSHAWISVPSYEINKVQENDTIVLKKAANGGLVSTISKYKILDISESVPTTISTSDSTDARFFVKVKKDSNLTSETISQGGITGNAEINSSSSNWVGPEYTVPSNALYLGQYAVADSQHEDKRYRYYFKDGKIIEVEDQISNTYTIANSFSGATFNQQPSCDSNQSSDWATKSATYPFTDSTGTVSQIYFKNVNTSFPDKFYICYSSTNTPSGSGSGPAIFETVPDDNILDIYYEISDSYPIADYNTVKNLDWYNAFDFSDGVESNRIKDDFNEVFISTQIKASTTIDSPFKQKTNKSGLIYSGLYNSRNGVNNLNQFNTGEKITKDLNPEYGSIQKLHARDTDLIAFCEDKVLKILANKDALFNADGNVNLVSTNNVLGQAIPYSGEFGISKDPESFATNGNRIYFADKSRNSVLRLSRDGLTIISSKGMKTYFRDKINSQELKIVGAYDQFADQYIISFDHTVATEAESVSFKEDVDGWVSRLTYIIKPALSINGKFYSFNNGNLYEHYHPSVSTNTFHSDTFKSSGLQLIFNQEASAIKNFKTISYEGTQAKTSSKQGWSVGSIVTDQQQGQVIDFKEKEGKWFANISGVTKDVGIEGTPDIDAKEFAIQGLGNLLSLDSSIINGATVLDCKDFNFTMASGDVGDNSTSVASVSIGTINSITPAQLQAGNVTYTATIAIPSQYGNTASTIDCTFELNTVEATTLPVCSCSDFGLSVSNGLVGDPVVATVTSGTIQSNSISPGVYQTGTATYTATIVAPAGCSNENATINCTDTATATAAATSYDCSTFNDWATIQYHPGTGAITVSPVRSSTTIHSYTPTTHAPNSGNVNVTYVFSDNGSAWGNTNTQVTCTNGLTVNTNVTYTADITGPVSGSVGTDISLTAKLLASNAYHSNIDVTTQLSNAFTWSGSAIVNNSTLNPLTFNESVPGSNYAYTVSINAGAINNAGGPYTHTHNVDWSEAGVTLALQSASEYQTANAYTLTATATLVSNAQFEFQKSVDLKQTWTVIQALSSDNTFDATEACGNAGTGTYTVYYRVRMTGTNIVSNTSLNIFDNNDISILWVDRQAISLYSFIPWYDQTLANFDCTQDVSNLTATTYYTNAYTGVGLVTSIYPSCTGGTQTGVTGAFLYVSGATRLYAYFNNGNIVAQAGTTNGWKSCGTLTLSIVDGSQTVNITGQTITRCAGVSTTIITANPVGFDYDEILWTPTGSTSLKTTATSSTPQNIVYGCTLYKNNEAIATATTTVIFESCAIKVKARKCGNTEGYAVVIINGVSTFTSGVFNLTAGTNQTLPEGDGCYTILEPTTESLNAEVTAVGPNANSPNQPYSDCNACDPTPTDPTYYKLTRCLDGAEYRTSQLTSAISYSIGDFKEYNTQTYQVTGTTTNTNLTAYSFNASSATSCPAYYGLKKCSDQSTNHRSSVDVGQLTLSVNDRVNDILSGEFYVVLNNTAISGNLATVVSTGLTGCPEPTQNYYQIRECTTGTDYRTQRTTTAVNLFVGNIVYNQTGDVFFTVMSNTAQVGDFPEYSTNVYQSPYSTCPLGAYSCSTHSNIFTASYDSSNGAITLNSSSSTAQVLSFSPITATAGQGDVTVTYSFKDTDPNYTNTNATISGCTTTVDTGTATVYRATFVDCAGSGAVKHVRSVSQIDTDQVISDGSKCYKFLNNNGDSSNEADISTYTIYNEPDLDSTGNCGVCDAVVNPTTTTTTTTTLAPCIAVNVYRTRFNPATNPDAMNILCGGGFATTQYFNASSVGAATIYYSDFTCTTYKSTAEYISDANNTSQYYYWNGSSLTLIGNTGPCP